MKTKVKISNDMKRYIAKIGMNTDVLEHLEMQINSNYIIGNEEVGGSTPLVSSMKKS